MNNIIGLILSYLLVGIILSLVKYLESLKIKACYNRKVIHIAISHWWIIAMFYFDHVFYAIIPPITYLIANILSRKYKLVKAMEEDSTTLGTIYYPISMIILTILCFGVFMRPHVGLIGIFTLAYGDGLASVIGIAFGKTCIYQKKTIVGTTSMFIVSFIVSAIITSIYNGSVFIPSLIFALTATVIELFSPKGTDNLTVPIILSLLYNYIYYTY